MRELATYIDESFFKNVGSDKVTIIAKGQEVIDEFDEYLRKNGVEIQKTIDTYRHSKGGTRTYDISYREVKRLNEEIENRFISKLPIEGVIYITTKEHRGSETLDFIKTSGVGPIAFKKACEGSPRKMSLLQSSVHIQNGKYALSNFGTWISNSSAAAALYGYGELGSSKYCLGFYYDE